MKTTIKILILLLFLIISACATYRNPVPRNDPYFTKQQLLQPRFKYTVGIKTPQISDFKNYEHEWNRDYQYKWMLNEAKRLVYILKKLEVFDDVKLINDIDNSTDLIVETVCRPPNLGDPDHAWLLLYLGVFPVYQGKQRGIYFKFIKGGTGELSFDWVEEVIISIYSWAISGLSEEWQSMTEDSKYWKILRKKLVETIYEKIPNAQQYKY